MSFIVFITAQFSTRINVLGHVQQGGCASPFDRNSATKFAARACEQMIADMVINFNKEKGKVITCSPKTCTLLGLSVGHSHSVRVDFVFCAFTMFSQCWKIEEGEKISRSLPKKNSRFVFFK